MVCIKRFDCLHVASVYHQVAQSIGIVCCLYFGSTWKKALNGSGEKCVALQIKST